MLVESKSVELVTVSKDPEDLLHQVISIRTKAGDVYTGFILKFEKIRKQLWLCYVEID